MAPYTWKLIHLVNEHGKLLLYSSSLQEDAPFSKRLESIWCYVQTIEKSHYKGIFDYDD